MDFEIGQKFKDVYPPEAAAWCVHNNAHMEPQEGGGYMICQNHVHMPSRQEKVVALEMQYSMYRWRRKHVIDHPEQYDEWTVSRAREIEALAAPLRNDIEG